MEIELLLSLAFILVGARLVGRMSQQVGMPAVLGELLAGLILGPSLLGWVHLNETLMSVADLGVLLLMFVAGLETDLGQLRRVGKPSSLSAVAGVLFPFLGGLIVSLAFGLSWLVSLFIATALTATSVSVSVQTLSELGRLKSKEGYVILGAAVIDDVLGVLILSLVLGIAGQGGSVAMTLLRVVLFFPLALLVGQVVVTPVVRWITQHHAREVGFALILALVLLYSWAAEELGGLAAITGAYLAGVLMARIPEAREWVGEGATVMGHGLFVPVFFVTVGLQTDVRLVALAPVLTLVIIAVAVVGKGVGSALGARFGGCTWPESWSVGAGMIARGEVALVMAALGQRAGLLSHTTFAVVIVMTLVTTLLTPLLLKFTLPQSKEARRARPFSSVSLPVAVEGERV